MNKLAICALLLAGVPPAATAADAAAAAPAAATTVATTAAPADPPDDPSLAAPDCARPPIDVTPAEEKDVMHINRRIHDFQACINAYVTRQNALSQKHHALAQSAITEFNAYAEEFNAARSAGKQPQDKAQK